MKKSEQTRSTKFQAIEITMTDEEIEVEYRKIIKRINKEDREIQRSKMTDFERSVSYFR